MSARSLPRLSLSEGAAMVGSTPSYSSTAANNSVYRLVASNDTLAYNVSMSVLPKFNRGVTVLAVLSALDRRETYGYEIRREAFRRTKGLFTVNEGALYPLLH